MKRFVGIAILILALVGLSAPSLSVVSGLSGPEWSLPDTQVSATSLTRLVHCKSLGGKRVLPCHPDQGVMGGTEVPVAPQMQRAGGQAIQLPRAMSGPEAELPPPRLG